MDKLFVKVGDDRIRLSEIKNYGIKNGVRYLVKNAGMAQTDRDTFESISYTLFVNFETINLLFNEFLTYLRVTSQENGLQILKMA